MAIEVLDSVNPIVTTAVACAWITKDNSVKITSIVMRDIITALGTLVLTNGGVTTTLSNILIKRVVNGSALDSVRAKRFMECLDHPITVSRLFIHTNSGPTNCGACTLEIWKD